MGLLAGIASLAGPIAARVLLALGFSVMTVGGVALAWDSVRSSIVSLLGAQSGAYVQLAGVGGIWVALGIVVGGMSWAVTYWSLTKAVRIMGAG